MMSEYEQLELDTRDDLVVAAQKVTDDAINNIWDMAKACGEASSQVRNRHEAYGIAAQQLVAIQTAVKAVKDDVGTLLGTLPDPNYPALEATSSIVNSTAKAAMVMLRAAAEMRRTLDDLYVSKVYSSEPERTPMDEYASGGFEEAEPAETSDNE
jgi:hypothetical protein